MGKKFKLLQDFNTPSTGKIEKDTVLDLENGMFYVDGVNPRKAVFSDIRTQQNKMHDWLMEIPESKQWTDTELFNCVTAVLGDRKSGTVEKKIDNWKKTR